MSPQAVETPCLSVSALSGSQACSNPVKVSHVISSEKPSSPTPHGGAMKTAVYLLAIATILVAPHVSAGQSVNRPESTALRFDIQASDAELSPEVQRLLSRGDE